MTTPTRRAVVASATAGLAGLVGASLKIPNAAIAATSSAAGIVGGGSLAGEAGPINFSAFGTRITFDDGSDSTLLGALMWADASGLDGEMVTFILVSVTDYGPSSYRPAEGYRERTMTGTVSANGDGEYPFALILSDGGPIGEGTDHARLIVGTGVGKLLGTPVASSETSGEASLGTPVASPTTRVDYDVEGDLATGDIQIITLT